MVVTGLVWLSWRYRGRLGQWLGIYHTVSENVELTDPHGLHMRRCKDLVELARKYVGYRIFVRCPTARVKSWANARSIISLQMLGVRGPVKGEKPPVLEVQVQGLRPRKVLHEISQKLRLEPQKYLNAYELYEVAKEPGGQLAIRPAKNKVHPFKEFARRVTHCLVSWLHASGNQKSPATPPASPGNSIPPPRAKPPAFTASVRTTDVVDEGRPRQAGQTGTAS